MAGLNVNSIRKMFGAEEVLKRLNENVSKKIKRRWTLPHLKKTHGF